MDFIYVYKHDPMDVFYDPFVVNKPEIFWMSLGLFYSVILSYVIVITIFATGKEIDAKIHT